MNVLHLLWRHPNRKGNHGAGLSFLSNALSSLFCSQESVEMWVVAPAPSTSNWRSYLVTISPSNRSLSSCISLARLHCGWATKEGLLTIDGRAGAHTTSPPPSPTLPPPPPPALFRSRTPDGYQLLQAPQDTDHKRELVTLQQQAAVPPQHLVVAPPATATAHEDDGLREGVSTLRVNLHRSKRIAGKVTRGEGLGSSIKLVTARHSSLALKKPPSAAL